MDNFEKVDSAGKIKLRKGAGWLMTSIGGFNLLASIILIVILSITLYLAINGLSDINSRTESLLAVGLSWMIMLNIIGLIVFVIGTILSSLLIAAGLSMKKGKRRIFVTVVTIIWAMIVLLGFFISINDVLVNLSIFSFIKLLFWFVIISLWGFMIYALSRTWNTFKTRKARSETTL